jgi:pilus assembly protein Flp/PilA
LALDRTVYQQELKLQVLPLLLKDESGVTAIEYGLIAALIAVAAIGAFTSIGTSLSTTFSTVAGKL